MKTRQFFLFAGLLPILAFVLSLQSYAQATLPWERNTQAPARSGSGDGRSYAEPGEAYDPGRHGNSAQQGYSGPSGNSGPTGNYGQPAGPSRQGNTGGYDRGYDALRNNGRAQQGGQYRAPYADPPVRPYGSDRAYQAPRPYDRSQQGRQPDYYSQGSPSQGGQQDYPRQGGQQDYPPRGYQPPANQGPGQAYAPPSSSRGRYDGNTRKPGAPLPEYGDDTYSDDEILNAGHRFFGKITKGLAKVIAYVFKKSGRPNGYILGEEGGGAFVAGLRYGEGTVYTKAGDRQRIYWQGPSIGYDFGAEGAKTMILVYNLRNVDQLYKRYGGVDGSAYLVGGVGVTFQKRGKVVLAPIRSGVGVRLGANMGYLKYTRRPTWNPF